MTAAFRYLIVSLLCVMAVSCKMGDNANPYYPLTEDERSLSRWKPGSYWLLRDSLTGQTDSFFVTYFDSTTNTNHTDHYTNESRNIGITELNTATNAPTAHWTIRDGINGEYGNLQVIFSLPGSSDSTYGFHSFLSIIPGYTPVKESSFSINGKTFNHCFVNTDPLFNPSMPSTEFVLSKDSGFVYLRAFYGTYQHVWQLLRAYIIYP